MGLRDMFRRKSGKKPDKGQGDSELTASRGLEDATLMLADDEPSPGDSRAPDDATVALPRYTPGGDAAAASESNVELDRVGEATTGKLAIESAAATVAVAIPNFESANAAPPAPDGESAGVRDVGTETEPLQRPNDLDLSATVAVPVPNFDEAGPQEPQQDAAATVAVSIPNFEETGSTGKLATPAPQQDATVAVSIPNFDDNAGTTGRLAAAEPPQDATVAVSIPNFDEGIGAAGKIDTPQPVQDATVAVSIPNFDEDIGAAGRIDTPQPVQGATVAVSIPNFDEGIGATGRIDTPQPVQDATVAVSIPNFDDTGATEKLRTPPPPDDATVAVPVPNFEELEEDTAKLASEALVEDATIAAPAPGFEQEAEELGAGGLVEDGTIAAAGPGFEEAAAPQPALPAVDDTPPALEVKAEPEADPNDATRFDLPNQESERPNVAGVLVAIDGELSGFICAVIDGETKLGRSETCDTVLPSMKISREHATIVHQDGVFAILPLSDRNPTYVNEEVITGCELSDEDSVRMGRTTFRFRTIQGL